MDDGALFGKAAAFSHGHQNPCDPILLCLIDVTQRSVSLMWLRFHGISDISWRPCGSMSFLLAVNTVQTHV